jgi:hypothetical protein
MNISVCLLNSVLMTGTGDPGEDAAVATIVFLLDGKLVLLRPSARGESPATDLKYDMKILSDKIEFFMLLSNRSDELSIPLLNGSIWAWDGKQLNVRSRHMGLIITDLDLPSASQFFRRASNNHSSRLLSDYGYSDIWNYCRIKFPAF